MENNQPNIQPADRLSLVQEYYFSRKLKEVAQLNAEGKDIVSLAIGSPDMPPSKRTIDKLCEVANNPNAHGYQPTMGTPELRNAMAAFYKKWYGVELDPKTEIQPLIGSKEGILHTSHRVVGLTQASGRGLRRRRPCSHGRSSPCRDRGPGA